MLTDQNELDLLAKSNAEKAKWRRTWSDRLTDWVRTSAATKRSRRFAMRARPC